MKKLSFLLLMLIIAMAACKKSGSDGYPPNFNSGTSCRILTMSSTESGSSSFAWFYFNSYGKLLYTKDTWSSTPGDTNTGTQYKYQGNVLQYSWYYHNYNYSDTVFYFYGGSGKLQQTIEHNWSGSTLLSTTTDFYYNSANQVVHTLARSIMDTVYTRVDSIIYSYTGNNVTAYTVFERMGNGATMNVTLNMTYDHMKNFYKATGMPADSYLYWSENNVLEFKYADSTNA